MVSLTPSDGNSQDQSIDIAVQPLRDPRVDQRQQLYNNGESGPFSVIQVSIERILSLNAILFDIDPLLIRESSLTPSVPRGPREFYETVAKIWLSHHPVLRKAEVRISGTGLHVILRILNPPTFGTDGERDRWTGIVQAVQAALPIDTRQPHITAATRPIGSVNSKNGATVELLTPGEPVTQAEVLSLYDNMQHSPFKTVLQILAGDSKIKPCPFCNKPGKQLSALDRIGKCYGCGNVTLTQLYDLVLSSDSQNNVEASHDK